MTTNANETRKVLVDYGHEDSIILPKWLYDALGFPPVKSKQQQPIVSLTLVKSDEEVKALVEALRKIISDNTWPWIDSTEKLIRWNPASRWVFASKLLDILESRAKQSYLRIEKASKE